MKEKIFNFKQIIEDYYASKGNDGIFHFLHVKVPITYIDLHHEYIDGNDGWKVKEKIERIRRTETMYVPVIVDRQYYNDNYLGKIYDYDINPIFINDVIDIGNTDSFNYDELYKKMYLCIPKECQIIDNNELERIANLNGYSNFECEIYDAAKGKPAVFYGGQEWQYNIYGVKEKNNSGPKKK